MVRNVVQLSGLIDFLIVEMLCIYVSKALGEA